MDQSKTKLRMEKTIMTAFIELLEEQSFEKITVQDILDEALVSRHTFYTYYKDKYELAERLQEEMYGEFLNFLVYQMPSMGKKLVISEEEHKNISKHIFAFSKKNEIKLYALNKIHTEKVDFNRVIREYMMTQYQTAYKDEDHLQLKSQIYAGNVQAIMNYYFTDRFLESDENICQSVMNAYLDVSLHLIGISEESKIKKIKEYVSQFS